MMRLLGGFLAAFILLSFSSCTYDLEEKEGIYTPVQTAADPAAECDHHFRYGLTIFSEDRNIYPTDQYHYVSCVNYGIDPLCDFYPRCEEHRTVDAPSGINGSILAYNGHLYNVVPQICTVCGQSAGEKYILAETAE